MSVAAVPTSDAPVPTAIDADLLTLEDYLSLPDDGRLTELVCGRVIELTRPKARHGYLCLKIAALLFNFVEHRRLGRVLSNDTGIVTTRDPDSLRGMDAAYYSFERLPPGPLPKSHLEIPPEIVFEVRSPTDRWSDVLQKVAEYLAMGILIVGVIDPDAQSVHLFYPDRPNEVLSGDAVLTLAPVLTEFQLPLKELFENV